MTRIFLLSLILACLTTGLFAERPEPDFNPALEAFRIAMNSHDGSLMMNSLSKDFQIQGVPKNYNDQVIRQLAAQFPVQIDRIQVAGVTHRDGEYDVTVKILLHNEFQETKFVFDQEGDILEIGMLQTQPIADEAPAQNQPLPGYMQIPFSCREGLIVTDGVLDGKPGKWVVDSGAPRLIVNSKHSDPDAGMIVAGQGVSGEISDTGILHVISLKWGDWTRTDFDAISIDLSHLQSAVGDTLLGLIGFACLQPYQIRIDYADSILTLWLLDDLGDPVVPVDLPKPRDKLKFELQQHIPVFQGKIGSTPVKLGLDSGAAGNLLSLSLKDKLARHYTVTGSDTLLGANRGQILVNTGVIDEVRLHKTVLRDMATIFSDMTGLNDGYGLDLDGLVGYEFLRRQVTVLNYKRGELWVY
jgi:hypothetical protein